MTQFSHDVVEDLPGSSVLIPSKVSKTDWQNSNNQQKRKMFSTCVRSCQLSALFLKGS